MANKADDEFAAVAAVDSTCGVPYYLAVSTSAAAIASLPGGRYWVRLEGVSVVAALAHASSSAAVPTTGTAAASGTKSLAHGEVYSHAATERLSVIAHASGHLWLQPVAGPG